jgi:hypothetical protein
MRNSAKINVTVGGKSSNEAYELMVHTFEIDLFSKLDSDNSNKPYQFTFYNRKRVIKVNSLADIDVEL